MTRLQRRLLAPLSSLGASGISGIPSASSSSSEVITRSTRTVVEARAVETEPRFRFLEECLEWVGRQLVRKRVVDTR